MIRGLQTALVFAILVLLNGCASILYQHNRVEKATATTQPWLEVHHHKSTQIPKHDDPGGSWPKSFIFGFTPLGFLAPLFNYPIASDEISGSMALKYSEHISTDRITVTSILNGHAFLTPQTVTGGNITFDFETNKGVGTHSIYLRFDNKDIPFTLKKYGRATKIIPDQIVIDIICSNEKCTARANPQIISPDGLVQIKTEEVTDATRIQEIASEQQQVVLEFRV